MSKKEKKNFSYKVLNAIQMEDDALRTFKASRAGKELLSVQQSIFMFTGAYLPDNM